MANYYHEARAVVKAMKGRQISNKLRAERRAEVEDAQKDHPVHLLRLDGRALRLHRNDAASYALGQGEGLVSWNGDPGNMIDRFDGRALLESHAEPDASAPGTANPPLGARERELEEQLSFERYRDLVRLHCLGLTEPQGVEHADSENIAVRAHARATAAAAVAAAQVGPSAAAGAGRSAAGAAAAGAGQYAAVGFTYGGGGGGSSGESSGSGASDGDDSSDDDEGATTAEDGDMDARALALFGLEDFSSMLRWSMKREEAEAEANSRQPRHHWSRKKAALRSKRLAGQGLAGDSKYAPGSRAAQRAAAAAAGGGGGGDLSWIPERRDPAAREELERRFGAAPRGSPEYGGRRASPDYGSDGGGDQRRRRWRSRSRSRSRSRGRSPGCGRPGGGGRSRLEYITSFAAGLSGQPPGSGAAPQRAAAAAAAAPREALPGTADPALEGPALLPPEALRLHGVRAEDRHVGGRAGGSVSGRVYRRPSAAPAPAARVDKSKETPQERLKRLMAAQLDRKAQQDAAQQAQRRQQEQAELAARMTAQRAAEGDDPYLDRGRRRSRSRSPPRYHDSRRDRSRSRDRRR